MPPLTHDEQNDQQVDHSAKYSNDCDSAPCSCHNKRVRIRLDCNETVQSGPSRKEYTPDERNACWYSKQEKGLMHESHAKTALRMETGKRPTKNSPYRGLENLRRQNSSHVVHACVDAVMDEQHRQWDELPLSGSIDWELYREASLTVSRQCAIDACKVGTSDEREARKAYVSMGKGPMLKMKQERRKSVDSAFTETTEASDSSSKHPKMKMSNSRSIEKCLGTLKKKLRSKPKNQSGDGWLPTKTIRVA